MTRRIPLSEAALRLGVDYHQVLRLMLTGRLAGGRDEFGRLFVESRAIKQALATAAKGRGARQRRGRARG